MNRSNNYPQIGASIVSALVFVGLGHRFSQDADRKILKRVEPEYPAVLRDKESAES